MKGYPTNPEEARARFRETIERRFAEKADALYPEYKRLVNETNLSRKAIAKRLGIWRKTLERLEARWGVVWPTTPTRPRIGPTDDAPPGGGGKEENGN